MDDRVTVGLVLGLLLGFWMHASADDVAVPAALGETLHTVAQLLKVLVPPLILTAVIASIAALRDLESAPRSATRGGRSPAPCWSVATVKP